MRRLRSARVTASSAAAAFVVVAVCLVLPAALALRHAQSELRLARAALHAPVGDATPAELASRARSAAARARQARSATRSAWLTPWTQVPVAGRQVEWARRTTARWADLATAAATTATDVSDRLSASDGAPTGRLALLDRLDHGLADLQASLARSPAPSSGGLLPPFSGAASRVHAEEVRLTDTLGSARQTVAGLRRFLAGPDDYLVLAANNAEMRGLGGMALDAGLLHTSGGAVTAGSFRPTASLLLSQPVRLPSPLSQLYGWLDPGREWRNTDSSPNFPEVAPVYASMAEQAGFGVVRGVIQLDVVALDLLLGVVGPVTVDGTTFTAATAERLILHDLYGTVDEPGARHDELAHLAVAVSTALQRSHVPPAKLITALHQAVAGRHLLVWSSEDQESAAWRNLQIDGRLRQDGLLVTVQNHGGNKLDWYVHPAAQLDPIAGLVNGRPRYRLTVTVAVPVITNEPDYIVGSGRLGLPRGAYRALVVVNLPTFARDVSIDRASAILAGDDGPMHAVGVRVDVPAGGTVSVSFTFSLPAGPQEITVLPDGRVVPLALSIEGHRVDGTRSTTVTVAS